jgi:fructose-bisphosphate aldolase, class I
MFDIGRTRRWNRFIDPRGGKALIVPIDHGLTLGPVAGLDNMHAIQAWMGSGMLTGTIMHKGMVERLNGARGIGLMIHLNGSVHVDAGAGAPSGAVMCKPQLTTVDEALRLGADAVSVHLDMSPHSAGHYLALLGQVVEHAHARGLPVLAMLYDKTDGDIDLVRHRHFMRAAIEVGADVLKVQPQKDLQSLPELLGGMQMHTPVLFAGGKLASDSDLLALAKATVQCGAAGLCVGRNVFQRPDPVECLMRVNHVLNQGGAHGMRAVSDLLEVASDLARQEVTL